MPKPVIDLSQSDLTKATNDPINQLLVELSKPVGAELIDPERCAQVTLWTRSATPDQPVYRDPQALKVDFRHLGFFDDAGKLVADRVAVGRAFLHDHWQQPANYPLFWRHMAADAGLVSTENPNADYSAFTDHMAQLVDGGAQNIELAQAILKADQNAMNIPTKPLWQADRLCFALKLTPAATQEELQQSINAKDINWFPPDGSLQGLRRLLKDQTFGLGEAEFEAWIADKGRPSVARQLKGFLGNRSKTQTLSDLGILDTKGKWSETGFQHFRKAIEQARQQKQNPSLEWLRWTLHQRQGSAPIPFVWTLLNDTMPSTAQHRARRVASVALSGGMLGETVEVGDTLTSAQYDTLRKIGAWLIDPLEYQRHEALWWIGLLARKNDVNWENLNQISGFVFDKLDQTPDRELIKDWQAGVVTFEGAGRHQTSSTQPFKGAAKVGRNDPCPCGSGKKNKKCCGR